MVAIELFEIEPRAATVGCCYASEVIKRARCAEEGGHCFFLYCTALCEYRISLFIEHDNGVVCVCVWACIQPSLCMCTVLPVSLCFRDTKAPYDNSKRGQLRT